MYQIPFECRFLQTAARDWDHVPEPEEQELRAQFEEFLETVKNYATCNGFVAVDDTLDSLICNFEELAESKKKVLS